MHLGLKKKKKKIRREKRKLDYRAVSLCENSSKKSDSQ